MYSYLMGSYDYLLFHCFVLEIISIGGCMTIIDLLIIDYYFWLRSITLCVCDIHKFSYVLLRVYIQYNI